MCSTPAVDGIPASRFASWRSAGEVGLIFLVFFIQGAWPAPEVNEPHYLSKAKHYWDATWCARDFFCSSADAHQMFYWTFGWLTRFLPLPAVAWCGRLLTWGLLAWAWRRLSVAVAPAAFQAVLSAGLLVVLNDRCHMAGEWLIGGVEAKGFAFVLVLVGLESLVRGRWGRALVWFGAASALHVIVGGWAVVALSIAWLASPDRPKWSRLALPAAAGFLLALLGLAPALALTRGIDPRIVAAANQIYVFARLDHHLAPQSFLNVFIWRHLLLVAVFVVLVRLSPRDSNLARLQRFVAAAVGIAAAGFALGMLAAFDEELAAAWLRFYWFRLSDVMVPLGVSLSVCAVLARWQPAWPRRHAAVLAALVLATALPLGETVWRRSEHNRPPADAGIENLPGWRETCHWIRDNTPPDAVFLTPRLAQTFRWYAERAEVVNRKDIPQDAAGIVEWWRRMNRLHGVDPARPGVWRGTLAELGSARLRALGDEFRADYVVTTAEPPLALERLGPVNSSFAVYRLRSAESGPEGSAATDGDALSPDGLAILPLTPSRSAVALDAAFHHTEWFCRFVFLGHLVGK